MKDIKGMFASLFKTKKGKDIQPESTYADTLPMERISRMELPGLPDCSMDAVIDFAQNGWTLDEMHGLPHWQKVERNAIVLSLEVVDNTVRFRTDVNLKVVRHFAYLHDKCRLDNGTDLEHGVRSAEMLPSIRNTILKDFTDEEFSLLEQACRYHTTKRRTGVPTIDVCFDADRLDLGRVGIVPNPKKMATPQGAYYASSFWHWENSALFTEYYEKILCNIQ